MDNNIKKSSNKEEIVLDILKYLTDLINEKQKIFIKNSNGVYRDEIEQFRSEVQVLIMGQIIDKISLLRGRVYVPNDGRIGNTISGEGKEEKKIT